MNDQSLCKQIHWKGPYCLILFSNCFHCYEVFPVIQTESAVLKIMSIIQYSELQNAEHILSFFYVTSLQVIADL